MFWNCFILHVTTSYLQHNVRHAKTFAKNVLQMFCNMFANVLAQNICKTF